MTNKEQQQLLKDLAAYPTYGEMIDAILKMDAERKFVCMAAVAYSTMTEEKDQKQMQLFLNTVYSDFNKYNNLKKEKMEFYKLIYDKTFTVEDAGDDTYNIGVSHETIHNFLVDRLDLR
jgi:hypothetical protein